MNAAAETIRIGSLRETTELLHAHRKGKNTVNELQVFSEMKVVSPRDVDTLKPRGVPSELTVRSFGMTDLGKVRTNNEDQYLIAVLVKALQIQLTSLPVRTVHGNDRSHLFVVADGVGGNAGGEKASALAMDSVEAFMLDTFKWFFQFKAKEEDEVLAEFRSALGQANARVLAEAVEHPELTGMGTTLTLAYSLNGVLFVAHVGDSRCYLCRAGALHRLTRDHTLVAEMVRNGAIRANEAGQNRLRHVITNVVGGTTAELKVEVHKVHLEARDVLLLCSDGLTEMLADEEIASVLRAEADPEQACRQLVAGANSKGGVDNITVIVARYDTDTGMSLNGARH